MEKSILIVEVKKHTNLLFLMSIIKTNLISFQVCTQTKGVSNSKHFVQAALRLQLLECLLYRKSKLNKIIIKNEFSQLTSFVKITK